MMEIIKDFVRNGVPIRDDGLYSIIKKNKLTYSLYKEIMLFQRCGALIALVSLIIAIISVFYPDKGHLQIMGMAGLFHIFGAVCGEFSKIKKNRYLLLAAGLLNTAFFGVVQIFLILYILVADARTNPSKRDFKNETFFHIILIPWIIISVAIAISFLLMLITLQKKSGNIYSEPGKQQK